MVSRICPPSLLEKSIEDFFVCICQTDPCYWSSLRSYNQKIVLEKPWSFETKMIFSFFEQLSQEYVHGFSHVTLTIMAFVLLVVLGRILNN